MASGLPIGPRSKDPLASATAEDVPLLARHPLVSDAQNFLQPATVVEVGSELGMPPGAVWLHDLDAAEKEEGWPLLLDTSRLRHATPAATTALYAKPVVVQQATAVHIPAVQIPAVQVPAEPAPEVLLSPTHVDATGAARSAAASSQLHAAEGRPAPTGSDGTAEPSSHRRSSDGSHEMTRPSSHRRSSDASHEMTRPSSSAGGGPFPQPQRQASRDMSQGSSDRAEFVSEGGGGAQARAATGGHDPGSGIPGGNGTDNAPREDSQLLSQHPEPGPSPEAPLRDSQLAHFRKACRHKVALLREAASMVRREAAGTDGGPSSC